MYQITQFDNVDLPLFNPSQDHTGAQAESTLVDAIGGGAFDIFANRRRRGRKAEFSITGTYDGDTEYEIDHAGNYIVDHSGNRILVGSGPNRLRGKIEALRSKRGLQARLWRRRFDDNVQQWVTARLLEVQHTQAWEDRLFKAELTCRFETAMDAWRAETETTKSASLINGNIGVNVSGGPVAIHDTIITVVPSGGSMTFLRISAEHQGIDLRYTGTVLAGQTLTIDSGAQTVRINGVDAYTGFAFGSNHIAEGWCPIAQGLPVFEVQSNRAGTLTFRYFYQFI